MRIAVVISCNKFERSTLRIIGNAFYLLTIGLFWGVIFNLLEGAATQTINTSNNNIKNLNTHHVFCNES